MDSDEMLERLAVARSGSLGTVTSDLRPHLVPCCFVVDDDVIYSAVDGKPKSTMALRRLANVEARPTASLLVDSFDEDWSRLWWVRADGTARVLRSGPERDTALAALADKYEQYRTMGVFGAVIAIDIAALSGWRP